MSREKALLLSSWGVLGFLLIILVPKNKIRNAQVVFLFTQIITWLLGLTVVEKNLIRYPRRFFKKANKSSFTFEYFVFPSITVFFNLFFPEKNKLILKLFYYFCYISVLTGLEFIAVKYTKTIKYIHWKWYWSSVSMGFVFVLSRIYYKWFFKNI
ncbi:hypothetical protein H1D32_08400 [Anaerobacillus sp. CMMVII]|uniref:CBO0543 family protein n=1 Tax=Anaerobacillus sp. CMMVII TaxID=2755588 RepID=UPI0021B77982|nr:CBO0543 family protein [Anaerobacillus sp. CMMVII]MCT8137775.1 hypothetical protein [Anaerobacillus sp. CMMVII]